MAIVLADDLITNAYYLSNVVGRDLETVTGSQLADGLGMLNRLLGTQAITGRYIPYITHETLNTIVGVEDYTISDYVTIDAITFNNDDVRYSMQRLDRKDYFGRSRVDNILSLPNVYYVERQAQEMRIFLYPFPVEVYELRITGKAGFQEVLADADLTLIFPIFYLDYLEYKLASRICDFNSITFTPAKAATLQEMENKLPNVTTQDLSIRKLSTLSKDSYFNAAQANVGRGWRP